MYACDNLDLGKRAPTAVHKGQSVAARYWTRNSERKTFNRVMDNRDRAIPHIIIVIYFYLCASFFIAFVVAAAADDGAFVLWYYGLFVYAHVCDWIYGLLVSSLMAVWIIFFLCRCCVCVRFSFSNNSDFTLVLAYPLHSQALFLFGCSILAVRGVDLIRFFSRLFIAVAVCVAVIVVVGWQCLCLCYSIWL